MKQARLYFPTLLLAWACLILTACNYNKVNDDGAKTDKLGAASLESVDYAFVLESVIAPKCLTCHAGVTGNQGGTNLESLKSIRSLMSRIVYRSLERKDMPPGGLGERETKILTAWIDQGAPESIVGPRDTTADSTIEQGPNDWTKIRDRIFAPKCLDCHSGKDPQGALDLSTLQNTRLKAAAIFDRVIIQGNMPLAPYPALAPRERRVLLKWFDLGMPE